MLGLPRRFRMRPHDFAVLGLQLIGTTAGAGLTIAQFSAPDWRHWVGGAAIVLGWLSAAGITLAKANEKDDEKTRQTRLQLATALVEDVFRAVVLGVSKEPHRTGGVVFLPDGLPDGPNAVKAVFTYNKAGKPDGNLRFEKYQGCTGHAWAKQTQSVARLNEVSADDLRERWNLSPEYISMTQHLKTVVATPIWDVNNPRRMIGVVTLDCEATADECGLLTDEALNRSLELATTMARILNLTKLD